MWDGCIISFAAVGAVIKTWWASAPNMRWHFPRFQVLLMPAAMSLVLFLKSQPTTDWKLLKTNCVSSEHMDIFSCHDFLNNTVFIVNWYCKYFRYNFKICRGCFQIYANMLVCVHGALVHTDTHKQMHAESRGGDQLPHSKTSALFP